MNLALKQLIETLTPHGSKKIALICMINQKLMRLIIKITLAGDLWAYQAQTSKGLPTLLRHGDRNSMISSIEGRVPFLNT